MKKIIVILTVLLLAAASVSAQDTVWGSMYGKNNVRLEAGASYERSGSASQVGIYPSAEMIVYKLEIGNFSFIDIGAELDGRIGLPISSGADLTVGAGFLAGPHFGFRGLDFIAAEYVEKMDVFAKVGLKFDFIAPGNNFGFAVKSGVNYFLSESFAVGLCYTDWGVYSGGGVSVSLKLGDTPVVKGVSFDMPKLGGRKGGGTVSGFGVHPLVLQFYTLYYSAHFAGGFYPDSYDEGEETVYEITSMDSSGAVSYQVAKSLLEDLDGKRRLWGLEYDDGDDVFYYEYITDEAGIVETVFFDDDDEGVLELDASGAVNPEAEYLTWDDYGADKNTGVSINVGAGRFNADEYTYTDDTGVIVKWWISEDVPGHLLSYKMEDASDIVTSELVEINRGRKPRLY